MATTAAQEAAIDRAVRTAARARRAGGGRRPFARGGGGALPLAGVPARRLFRDGITVQPARLVRAVRRAALGGRRDLHEGTRVTRIDDGVLRTEHGVVRAPEIVVATNAWVAAGRRCAALTPFGSYVVLTEPVPRADRGDRLDRRRGDRRRRGCSSTTSGRRTTAAC